MAYDKRWDITVSSEIEGGGGKHRHARVGVAFLNEKGNLSIKLDPGVAIVGQPGVYINGFIPRPQDGQGYQGGQAGQAGQGGGYPQRGGYSPPPARGGQHQATGQGEDKIPF